MVISIKLIKALFYLSLFALLQTARARFSPGVDDMLKIGGRNIDKAKAASSFLVEEANKIRINAYEKPAHSPPPPPGQYGPGAPKPYINSCIFKRSTAGDCRVITYSRVSSYSHKPPAHELHPPPEAGGGEHNGGLNAAI